MSHFRSLPSKVNVGTPKEAANVVTVSNSKLQIPGATSPGYKFEVPAERFAYPVPGPDVDDDKLTEEQAEEVFNDFVTEFCGGKIRAAQVLRETVRDHALSRGKQVMRVATSGTPEQIIESGLTAAKGANFIRIDKLTTAEIRDSLVDLKANFSQMTPEQIQEQLAQLLSKVG